MLESQNVSAPQVYFSAYAPSRARAEMDGLSTKKSPGERPAIFHSRNESEGVSATRPS
jgi:hypothetical protein